MNCAVTVAGINLDFPEEQLLCSSGGQEASSRDFPPTPAERSQHISPRQALAAVPARAGLPTCLGLCSDQVTAAIYVSHTHRHSPAGEMVLPAKAATCWGHLSTLFPAPAACPEPQHLQPGWIGPGTLSWQWGLRATDHFGSLNPDVCSAAGFVVPPAPPPHWC